MSLLDSATDFLIESLENYRKGKLSFSVLHAVTATELMLKERLSRVHPNLIYLKIDSRHIADETTVGLKYLPQRLMNFGVRFSEDELEVIRTACEWRNEIVHHMPTYSRQQATNSLGLLYDFLARFLRDELQLEFKKLIPRSLFKIMDGLLKEWDRVTRESKRRAQDEGEVVVFQECPICGALGTVCLRENDKAFCHLCESELEVGQCPICHKQALDTKSDLDGSVYHWKCLDGVAQGYMEMWRESQLGK